MQDRSIGWGRSSCRSAPALVREWSDDVSNRTSTTSALHGQARQATRPSAVRLLLTPTEAAEQLAVSRTKVYELMAAGILRSIQIGRLRRVPVEALHEFIEVGELR